MEEPFGEGPARAFIRKFIESLRYFCAKSPEFKTIYFLFNLKAGLKLPAWM